jgi:hypothetical protein
MAVQKSRIDHRQAYTTEYVSISVQTGYSVSHQASMTLCKLRLLETFVTALLFATGCAEPSFVQLPINVPGNALWTGMEPSVWLTPSFPSTPGAFNFEQRSAHHVVRGHDLKSRTFLVLFNDQNHTKIQGSIVDPVNGQVTKICGKLPIDWFGNVFVIRITPKH